MNSGTLIIDEGTVVWYSEKDIYLEKNKLGLFDITTHYISKLRNKNRNLSFLLRNFLIKILLYYSQNSWNKAKEGLQRWK